jgi:hypothetical protein
LARGQERRLIRPTRIARRPVAGATHSALVWQELLPADVTAPRADLCTARHHLVDRRRTACGLWLSTVKLKESMFAAQAKNSISFLAVAVPCMWGAFYWTGKWPIAGFAAFMSLYLLMDALLLIRIKRAAKNDPNYLNRGIPGT